MRGIATSGLAVALPIAVFVVGASLMVQKRAANAPTPPMRRGIYSAYDVTSYWRSLGRAGVDTERHLLELDLVFPFVYGAALLASGLWLWAAVGRPFSPAFLVGLVGFVVFADWAENLLLLHELAPFLASLESTADPAWITAASAATLAKLAGGGASFLAVVALAVARTFGAR